MATKKKTARTVAIDPRTQATHDVINTADHWHAAGTVGGDPDGFGEDVSHGNGAADGGFDDHMRTMLQHVPWHAYNGGTLRAILLLILDGMPASSLERMRACAASEMEIVVAKLDGSMQAVAS